MSPAHQSHTCTYTFTPIFQVSLIGSNDNNDEIRNERRSRELILTLFESRMLVRCISCTYEDAWRFETVVNFNIK